MTDGPQIKISKNPRTRTPKRTKRRMWLAILGSGDSISNQNGYKSLESSNQQHPRFGSLRRVLQRIWGDSCWASPREVERFWEKLLV